MSATTISKSIIRRISIPPAMELKEAFESLRKSPDYAALKDENAFLFSCFSSAKGDSPDFEEWQFGFFLSDGMARTLFIDKNGVRANHKSEIFKSGKNIKKVDISKCRLPLGEALNIVEEKTKKLPFSTVTTMVILQVVNDTLVWNITKISKEFSIINVKIDAQNSRIIESNVRSVFDFKG